MIFFFLKTKWCGRKFFCSRRGKYIRFYRNPATCGQGLNRRHFIISHPPSPILSGKNPSSIAPPWSLSHTFTVYATYIFFWTLTKFPALQTQLHGYPKGPAGLLWQVEEACLHQIPKVRAENSERDSRESDSVLPVTRLA